MDHISITGIHAKTLIGVYDWERTEQRPIVIDLVLHQPLAQSGQSDQLADTLDYAAVVEWVKAQASNSQYELLEALAEHLAQGILQTYSTVQKLTLTLHKPDVLPGVDDIAICIQRP